MMPYTVRVKILKNVYMAKVYEAKVSTAVYHQIELLCVITTSQTGLASDCPGLHIPIMQIGPSYQNAYHLFDCAIRSSKIMQTPKTKVVSKAILHILNSVTGSYMRTPQV